MLTSTIFQYHPSFSVCSVERCSKPHSGVWNEQEHGFVLSRGDEGLTSCGEDSDLDMALARQVFFFGQNAFPLVCKHVKTRDAIDQLEAKTLSANRQGRLPNWVFRVGKNRHLFAHGEHEKEHSVDLMSSKLPDFIGCAEFGRPGVTDPKKCSLVKLPAKLQGANPDLMEMLLADARTGIFPTSKSCKGECPPLPMSFNGKHCPRPIHGQEAPLVRRIKCEVEYHYFFCRGEDTNLSWVIVVGTGVHKHTWPVLRPPLTLVKSFVRSQVCSRPRITSRELAQNIEERFGLNAPLGTVQKLHYRLMQEKYPFGRSLQALVAQYKIKSGGEENPYVISIVDERRSDEFRSQKEQIGVSIILCNDQLLRRCIKRPRLACDGSFGIVSNYDEDLNFELIAVVAKDDRTGKSFAVMRQLSSRKTTAARKMLFEQLLSRMEKHGLQNPLQADTGCRLTLSTDFETTFAYAFGLVLAEKFPPDTATSAALSFLSAACYGCDVHAKRVIMEKCDVAQDPHLFSWAVGTRNVESKEEADEAVKVMIGLGGKWESFAHWLQKNKVANLLWFTRCNSGASAAELAHSIFWDTNPCEAMNARIKGQPNYLLSNRRGLDLVEVIELLEKMDSNEARNLSRALPTDGIQYTSKPEWKRTQAKARKRNPDNIIVIEDDSVSAQQPRKAKKASLSSNRGVSNAAISALFKKTDELAAGLKLVLEKLEKGEEVTSSCLRQLVGVNY